MDTFKSIVRKYPKLVKIICSAATLAGTKIMEVYSKDDFGIQIKEDDSPLTIADSLADLIIGEILNLEFPNIPVVSEESDRNPKTFMDKVYFLVDPLDGTKEFIKKTGEFTVNIAVIVNAKAEFGVVYVPVKGELYYRDIDGFSYLEYVEKDSVACKNRTQISCRTADMNNLSVVKSLSHATPATEDYITSYAPSSSKSAGSSLKFGLIATGVADLYPRLGRTMEWDTGAAHAVLKGAGGNVRCLDTLEELSYGKIGMENPFFVASSDDMFLKPYNGGS